MNITIFRRRFTPWGVDGTLVINGVIFSGTLEHPYNYLPAGDYVIISLPLKFKKKIEVVVKKKHHKKEKVFKTKIVEEYKNMPVIHKEEHGFISPLAGKPYITAGSGPLALKHGSIVMGKSLMTGLVAYDEKLFQKFCKKIDELSDGKEMIDLHIKYLGKEEIPLKYLAFFPGKVL